MNSHAGTRLGAFVMPLVLLALIQGGRCGGADNRTATNMRSSMNGSVPVANISAGNRAEGRSTPALNDNSTTNVNSSGAGASVAEGQWGGRSARLNVRDDGAEIEFDCAHGRMGRLTTDAQGNFDVSGVFVLERGGPVRIDEQENARPARYTGRIEGTRMTIKVVITNDKEMGEPVVYTLTHGASGRLTKCL